MKNILAFEADPALAEELKGRFAQYGCAVDVVDDGNLGLQKARANKPDLILLTIELPKMNGFSICNKLKKNPELKTIPLIILSSEATEDTFAQHRKLRTHAEDYLRKPFDFNELITKIGGLIQLDVPQQPVAPDAATTNEEISVDTSDLEVVVEDDIEEDNPLAGDDLEAFADSAFEALQMEDDFGDDDPGFDTEDRTVAVDRPMDLFDMQPPAPAPAETPPASPPEDMVVESDVIQEEVAAQPSGEVAAQPSGEIAAQPSGEVAAPPSSEIAAQPSGEIAAPPSGEIATPPSGEIAAPPSGEIATPPSGEIAAPPSGEVAAPPSEEAPLSRQEAPTPVGGVEPPRDATTRELSVEENELLAGVNDELLSEKAALEREAKTLRESKTKLEDSQTKLREELEALKGEKTALDEAKNEWETTQKSLEREKEGLKDQISLLKDQLAKVEQDGPGAGAVSSREFLDLRELLNKKDRELLDYKDQINSKEKALLDHRERITSLEREIAEGQDRLLAIERDREEVREKLHATEDDKTLLNKKLDGLKKRLESSGADVERLKTELAEAKSKHSADLEAAEVQKNSALEELRQSLSTESSAAQEAALAALRQELTAEHEGALEAAKNEKEQALKEAEERREQDLTDQRMRHETELATRVEDLELDGQKKLEELGAQHAQELEALRKEKNERIAQVEQAQQQSLTEATQAHQEELEALKAKIAELETNLADKTQELADTTQRLNTTVDWNAHNEQRAQRALEKMAADGDALEKSKRALAIALSLLSDIEPHKDPGPPQD